MDSWYYADFNDKQNLIDKFIPKDIQNYYTSGEYQKRNLELAKLPYGTYKNDPKLYDKISPDSVIRDKWGIYFINEYDEGINNLLNSEEYYDVTFQKEYDLKDYNAFQEFRNLEGDFTVEKINGAARRLLPHRVMFSFDGQNQVDYYSLDSSNLINYFNYIKSLDKDSNLYKLKTQEYLYIIKRSISDFNLTHPLMSSIISKIENGLNAESELTDKEFNILKNI
jgi:hypothetical protein